MLNCTKDNIIKFKLGKNSEIHPTAIVEEGAVIGSNVKVGPYSIIGSNVKIGDDCELKSHVVIQGHTTIGKGNTIFQFAVVGEVPQDLKYEGEKSEVIIGDNNSIREHCTIHAGTKGDNLVTKIGNNNLLMVNTHVAHDCIIGNNCIFANNATLAGHVHVDDFAFLGGLSAVHQKVKIGKGSMVGGLTGLAEDLIPYGMAYADNGRRGGLQGLNLTGLKRRGVSKQDIQELMHFYREVFESEEPGSVVERAQKIREKYSSNKYAMDIADFLGTDTSRRFCTSRAC